MLPIASTMLLQPFITPVNRAAAAISTPQNAVPAAKANTDQKAQRPPSIQLNQYYTDANRIPAYAVGSVEEATRSNIVVNHPNVRQLHPQRPATRGEVAAIVYQAMANRGYVQPLPESEPAARYIVKAER